MERLSLCALVVCLGLTACGARSNRSTGSSNSNSQKISFGVYDIARSGPSLFGGSREQNLPAQTSNTAASISAEPEDGDSQEITLAQRSSAPVETAPSDRKVIRNAELNLESDDPETAQRHITSIAESKGGFVIESQQSISDAQSTARDVVSMSVRVPSNRFSETLDDIRKTASRVVVENVKGQDVTEEFIDIDAQLKAKKALEEQFMTIMKRSSTVDDALNVQRQLADVRGEIERIEGRLRFLQNQSSLSTIRIQVQTPKAFAASSAGFGTQLADAFSTGFDVAIGFVLGLVTFVIATIPFAMFVGLPLFWIIRYVLRRQSRPKSLTRIAEEEIQQT